MQVTKWKKKAAIGGIIKILDIKYRRLWFPVTKSISKEVSKEVKNRSMPKPGSQSKQLERETQTGV